VKDFRITFTFRSFRRQAPVIWSPLPRQSVTRPLLLDIDAVRSVRGDRVRWLDDFELPLRVDPRGGDILAKSQSDPVQARREGDRDRCLWQFEYDLVPFFLLHIMRGAIDLARPNDLLALIA
jgi:hypothetical protein